MTMLLPQSMTKEKVQDLLDRGFVVERDGLEFLAQNFEAAREALDEVQKQEHEKLEAIVVMDPDEDALVVLWRTRDADDIPAV